MLTFRDLDHPDAGGAEVHASHVCAELAAAGLDVTLRTGAVAGQPEQVERRGFRVIRRGGRLGVFPSAARDERARRLGPVDGLIDVFHGVPFFAPVWARRTPQVGVVHHVHLGVWHHLLPAPGATVGHLAERFAVPVAYRHRELVTVAGSTRLEVLRHYRADPGRLRVAYSGVAPVFSPGGERSAEPLVLAVARLMPQKAVPTLVAAFARVRDAVPDARLAIVGEGPERPTVEAAVRTHGVAGAVDLVGFVREADLVGWYRQAWVVASASVREGYGLTLTEAAACGTPAVASRIPGHVDAVDDGVSGLLADGVGGLADALVRVLTDADLRDRLGRGALAHAAPFRWERSAQVIFDALCDDADRRR
jgi:glycosyltransferase involved in cell wall biosynthesis